MWYFYLNHCDKRKKNNFEIRRHDAEEFGGEAHPLKFSNTFLSCLKSVKLYVREFSVFCHEIYMVARSYRVLAADIKSALGSLETRPKVKIVYKVRNVLR